MDRNCRHRTVASPCFDLSELRHLRKDSKVGQISSTARQHHQVQANDDNDARRDDSTRATTEKRHHGRGQLARKPEQLERDGYNSDDCSNNDAGSNRVGDVLYYLRRTKTAFLCNVEPGGESSEFRSESISRCNRVNVAERRFTKSGSATIHVCSSHDLHQTSR